MRVANNWSCFSCLEQSDRVASCTVVHNFRHGRFYDTLASRVLTCRTRHLLLQRVIFAIHPACSGSSRPLWSDQGHSKHERILTLLYLWFSAGTHHLFDGQVALTALQDVFTVHHKLLNGSVSQYSVLIKLIRPYLNA